MKKLILSLAFLLSGSSLPAQKRVLSYPFEFEKSFLAKSDYDAYFLDSKANSTFALILKDNKKAEYVLLDKNFKTLSKVSVALESSILDKSNYKYVGGTSNRDTYHFVFRHPDKDIYGIETVDFSAKTTSYQQILDLPKEERFVAAFSYADNCYMIAASDKNNELIIYHINENGELATHKLAFPIPEAAGKVKLHEYLKNVRVFKYGEEPDLSEAVKSRKLFCTPEKLVFTINDKDDPTHVYTVKLPSFTTSEQSVSYSDIISKGEKGRVYVNSFVFDDVLYSLVLNKKNIRVALHDIRQTPTLLTKYEVNEENDNFAVLASPPVTERRLGKKVDEQDISSTGKLIRMLSRGTEGIMVSRNNTGKLVVTVGTYDLIQMSSGGSSGGWVSGVQPTRTANGITMVYNPFIYYRPGVTAYTYTSARFFTSSHFKYLLDPVTFKPARGRVPEPTANQIKDYMETVDKKAKAINQFPIGKNQYFGYYNPDLKSYVIEQIVIY